ncbi:GNAT family N-acetyltransferase [Flagellimonas pelagia]|uniref:N-acetyltransferase n=1 Tax=Flagellimonas pelagia TaxID=2306998 RepID=A0A3A1NCI8_9FLAO|nr:GNAT family N-acetyltransferase [Allomuricauda maritima]RIV42046.1 N-acetyltransferase [Allomuricauda maritima]TXJ90929.1 GNAT family N-acetyltransferase [Allomuricauda maritima]
MLKLKGDNLVLRALEPSDLDFLYQLENDTSIWEISGTLKPYSKKVLQLYLENAHRDIYEVKQLRLCICDADGECIGLIDLFDFDPKNRRAGIGIVIANPEDRNKGVGAEALSLLCNYAFSVLDLHQLYANILEDNQSSIHLFEKMGFERIGVKKEWIRTSSGFKNEIMFQKINLDES